MLASMQRNGLRLALFAMATTALVSGIQWLTAEPIAQQQAVQLKATLGRMLPEDRFDNDLLASCRLITSPQYLGDNQPHTLYLASLKGKPSAYIIESVAAEGYGGSIKLLTAMDAQGRILRVEVLGHNETPGLGDKIERRKSDWLDGLAGQRLQGRDDPRWAVDKDGGMFDSFTGATITPRAVVKGVRQLLLLLKDDPKSLTQAPPCQELP